MAITASFPGGAEPRFEFGPEGHLGLARAAVTERDGGVSRGPFRSLNLGRSTTDSIEAVHRNERTVLTALGLDRPVARLLLEHGARVLAVDGPGMHGPADALFTAREDLVLWITVADCFPLFVTAGRTRALGHCGWRGVAAGLVEAVIAESARSSGLATASLRAWVGPGIGPCCFEVGPEVAQRFPESSIRRDGQRLRLDLKGEILRRVQSAGLPSHAVLLSSSCTCCDSERFFSHRRDRVPSGRMAALLWATTLPPDPSSGSPPDASTGSQSDRSRGSQPDPSRSSS